MSEENSQKPARSFYIISGVALAWNLVGVAVYVSQVTMSQEALDALPEAQRMLMENTPSWATSAFAIAVNGGALGCLLLLLRKEWAFPVLIGSLLGVVVQMIHAFFIANSIEVYGPGAMIMPIMVLLISIFLVWYSRAAKEKGWLS